MVLEQFTPDLRQTLRCRYHHPNRNACILVDSLLEPMAQLGSILDGISDDFKPRLVDGILFNAWRELGKDGHYARRKRLVERVIRGEDLDLVSSNGSFTLEERLAASQAQLLRLWRQSDNTPIIIRKHDRWRVVQCRLKYPFAGDVKVGRIDEDADAPLHRTR